MGTITQVLIVIVPVIVPVTVSLKTLDIFIMLIASGFIGNTIRILAFIEQEAEFCQAGNIHLVVADYGHEGSKVATLEIALVKLGHQGSGDIFGTLFV